MLREPPLYKKRPFWAGALRKAGFEKSPAPEWWRGSNDPDDAKGWWFRGHGWSVLMDNTSVGVDFKFYYDEDGAVCQGSIMLHKSVYGFPDSMVREHNGRTEKCLREIVEALPDPANAPTLAGNPMAMDIMERMLGKKPSPWTFEDIFGDEFDGNTFRGKP